MDERDKIPLLRDNAMVETEQRKKTSTIGEIAVLNFLIFAWLTVFIIGVTLKSSLIGVNASLSMSHILAYFFIILVSWTWSNLVGLCCLASVIGEVGRVAQDSSRKTVQYSAAILRGFFIYLIALSGQLVLNGTLGSEGDGPFNVPRDTYFRLAGIMSLASFLVGYNPSLFIKLIKQMETKTAILDNDNKKASESHPDPSHRVAEQDDRPEVG